MQERLNALIHTTVTGLGYEVWGYEYRPYAESALLRIFIDSPNGITVDDCGKVSNQIGAALDVEDLIPVAYVLEVSSPGVDRVLFTPEQYQRYIGEKLKVRTQLPVQARRNFVGILRETTVETITLELEDGSCEIPYAVIDRGRLVYEMKTTPKKGKRSGAQS